MKCSKAAFGEQKQGMNLQQHKQHDSTIIPLGNNTPQRQGLFFKTIIVFSRVDVLRQLLSN
jgi:hypothetical protein